ncbi:hypothetical protein [Flavivirga jejuensis]|uniref:DUF4374 domain-containing protein n=1 Tax=Flavivirga jejuensis TaxID=870487 RepID=A0ABT8WSB2_9FLAO|nr:hypothetical protein [Flavivirga jejuensis]MDO5976082.1 hypothetical protein [Flavivirga jejuensis]
MKTNKLLKRALNCFFLALSITFVACSGDEPTCESSIWYADTDNDGLGDPNSTLSACEQPEGYVSNSDDNSDTLEPLNSKFTVGAAVDGEGYFVTTDNISSGTISIVGNGYEGWANLSVSVEGFLYNLNGDEGTLDKYEFTDNGLVKRDAISTTALLPGSFFRYIQDTGSGDLFLSNFPNEDGDAPYAIIDLETFTVEGHGLVNIPDVNGKDALWVNGLVKDNEIYFGSLYGDWATWTQIEDSLITVKFDYPSLTNPEILVSTASAGQTAGYRNNGTFKTENGDIYQYNLTSSHWYSHDELVGKPTVFTRIKDGDYDDYVLDVSASFSEPIAIWNAWYAGNDIVYASVVKEADITVWDDLKINTNTLIEVNLATKTVTELNIPKASYVDIFNLNCVENGKFYLPVSISGGEANIYQIDINGGANGFQKGAVLDGSNVFVNSLHRNF